jgi:hypothetical protein
MMHNGDDCGLRPIYVMIALNAIVTEAGQNITAETSPISFKIA